MHGRSTTKLLIALVGAALPLAALGASAHGAGRAADAATLVVRTAHGPVTARNSQYLDLAPRGPSVGDVRTYYVPLTRAGGTGQTGYVTGTLTTVATGRPRAGMELRAANLVFVLGRPANQIVVGGVSAYAQTASTLAKRSVVTRPVVGGSGTFAGATGWCVSTHLTDDTWTHVLHLQLSR
jgi:hypothetical protein